jgi:hypothetical protein
MGNCLNIKQRKPFFVSLVATTCPEDFYNHVDFEVGSSVKIAREIYAPCRVVCNGRELELQSRDLNNVNSAGDPLATVCFSRGHFWVYNVSKEPMWITLKNPTGSRNEPGMKLKKNDVFRFGNCKFIVREIKLEDQIEEKIHNKPKKVHIEHRPTLASIDNEDNSFTNSIGPSCRICFGSESTEDNPLMESPCKCIGSVRLVHKNCLLRWLRTKVKKRVTMIAQTFYWKRPRCDVCQEYYPDRIKCPNNTFIEVPDIKRPESDYIIIESAPSENVQNKCKWFE